MFPLVKSVQPGERPLSRVAVCGLSDKVGNRENKPLRKRGGRERLVDRVGQGLRGGQGVPAADPEAAGASC